MKSLSNDHDQAGSQGHSQYQRWLDGSGKTKVDMNFALTVLNAGGGLPNLAATSHVWLLILS